MLSTVIFLLVLGLPFIIYLVNSGVAAKERRGIAAGIPKPKQPRAAKVPKPGRGAKTAKVRSRRVEYCGRGFTHFALALVGSQDSCRYCQYLQEVPATRLDEPPSGDDSPDDDPADEPDNAPVPIAHGSQE